MADIQNRGENKNLLTRQNESTGESIKRSNAMTEIIPEATKTTTTTTTTSNLNERSQVSNTLTMKELLREMHLSLQDFMEVNKKIPSQKIKECKAILFLSLMKGGVGEGVLLTRSIRRNWNAPCAVSIKYKSNDIDYAFDKINYLLLINNEKIFHLPSKEYMLLGSDIPMSFQNDNQNDELVSSNNSLLYLLSKGSFDNNHTALNGAVLTINKLCNQQYFQNSIEEMDILNGNIRPMTDNEYLSMTEMLNSYIGVKHDEKNVKQTFEFNTNIPLYRYYVFSEKNFTASHQQLTELPVLPFLGDVKKSQTTGAKVTKFGKKIYGSIRHLWHSDKHKNERNVNENENKENFEMKEKWYCDINTPLFQYYCNNMAVYDRKQLSCLPKFPFRDDIVYKKYLLRKYNPITAIKSYYKLYVNKKENKNLSKHWKFDENIPLYQYYIHNGNVKEMMNSIQYNKAFLSKLPSYPFAQDIKVRKYNLSKFNPLKISRRFYHKMSSKFNDSKNTQSVNDNNNNKINDFNNNNNLTN